jgi:hypothetical protein
VQKVRQQKLREATVIDSTGHPQYKLWATNALTKTPIFHDYYFYNLTNAADFLTGA